MTLTQKISPMTDGRQLMQLRRKSVTVRKVNSYLLFGKSFAFIISDIGAQEHKHALITYLFMIYERFRRYSHFPHQVANNGINCYDTKLSKYQFFREHNYVNINVAIDNRYI